jgi:hypothetical protein
MRLREWDWNEQGFVERDYPDEPIRQFINWLRTTKQWYQSPDPGRDVYTKYRQMQEQLADHRNREAAEEQAKEKRRAMTAAARTANARKRKSKNAAAT